MECGPRDRTNSRSLRRRGVLERHVAEYDKDSAEWLVSAWPHCAGVSLDCAIAAPVLQMREKSPLCNQSTVGKLGARATVPITSTFCSH